jgi:phosphoribosyl-ATP pyrophosphohydrolase
MNDSLLRLYKAVLDAKAGGAGYPRTAKLLADGIPKMAKKVAEEAVEVSIDAVKGDRQAVVLESADLIYNLVVLWAELGIRPEDVWREMERRENLYGIAEKLPKAGKSNGGIGADGTVSSSAQPLQSLAYRVMRQLRRAWQRVFRP